MFFLCNQTSTNVQKHYIYAELVLSAPIRMETTRAHAYKDLKWSMELALVSLENKFFA